MIVVIRQKVNRRAHRIPAGDRFGAGRPCRRPAHVEATLVHGPRIASHGSPAALVHTASRAREPCPRAVPPMRLRPSPPGRPAAWVGAPGPWLDVVGAVGVDSQQGVASRCGRSRRAPERRRAAPRRVVSTTAAASTTRLFAFSRAPPRGAPLLSPGDHDVTFPGSTIDTACGADRTAREGEARCAAYRASGAPRPRRRAVSRVGSRAGSIRARSWTGRARASRATDSGLPPFVTAGTHRTRVSEMRDGAPRRRGTSSMEAPAAPGASPSPSERSERAPGRHQPRWHG